MSRARHGWQPSDDRPQRIGGPPTLSMPDEWTLSTAWQRAHQGQDHGGPITDAERMVRLSDGDSAHRAARAHTRRRVHSDPDRFGPISLSDTSVYSKMLGFVAAKQSYRT
jgi:hypothetical protein